VHDAVAYHLLLLALHVLLLVGLHEVFINYLLLRVLGLLLLALHMLLVGRSA
jgi:hypothetical protein